MILLLDNYVIWGHQVDEMIPTSMSICSDINLAMSFDIILMQVGDVSLGEYDEIIQELLFFLPHDGSYVFYLSCPSLHLVDLVSV